MPLYAAATTSCCSTGLIVVILGFVLMAGGGSDSPDEFNYAMFSWRRITLAPILVIGGFVIEIYAILQTITNPDFSDRRNAGLKPAHPPDTDNHTPRTVKWTPFKLSSWASSRASPNSCPYRAAATCSSPKNCWASIPKWEDLTFDRHAPRRDGLEYDRRALERNQTLGRRDSSRNRFNAEQAYVLKTHPFDDPGRSSSGFTLEPFLQSLVEDLPNHGILAAGRSDAAGHGRTADLRLLRQTPPQGDHLLPRRLHHRSGAGMSPPLPGLSRSGTTIATGLILGNRKETPWRNSPS